MSKTTAWRIASLFMDLCTIPYGIVTHLLTDSGMQFAVIFLSSNARFWVQNIRDLQHTLRKRSDKTSKSIKRLSPYCHTMRKSIRVSSTYMCSCWRMCIAPKFTALQNLPHLSHCSRDIYHAALHLIRWHRLLLTPERLHSSTYYGQECFIA